jgi:hypothetical protein
MNALLSLGLALISVPAFADEDGKDKAMESVVEGTGHHETVLDGVMETAPEEALPGLEKALDNSSRGQSKALEGIAHGRFDSERRWEQRKLERSQRSFERPSRGSRKR